MRSIYTILVVLLAVGAVSYAGPVPSSTIWAVSFSVVDMTYNPVSEELRIAGESRVAVLTEPDGDQISESDLWMDLVISLYSETPGPNIIAEFGSPMPPPGPGYLRIGRDGESHATGSLLDVVLNRMYMESTTSFIRDRLVALSLFDMPPGSGDWADRAYGPEGSVSILGSYVKDSLHDLNDISSDPLDPDKVSFDIYFVPEPATMSLLALGGVALLKRRK